MKWFDQLMRLNPAQCIDGNLPYEIYRDGLFSSTAGVVAVVGGLALESLTGIEVGEFIAAGGGLLAGLGGVAAAAGMTVMENE
jgi:hypothetical protein